MLKRLYFFSAIGIIVACLLALLIDQSLGYILNRSGYFKAMKPNVTIRFDTNEFSTIATISAQGIRNDPVTLTKASDTFRILALGDSFTFGWGVNSEQTWVKILEKKLSIPGKNIEIINAGVPSGTLTQERHICKAYKDLFTPDMIIQGMFMDDIYQAASSQANRTTMEQFMYDYLPTLQRLNRPIINTFPSEDIASGSTVSTSELWKAHMLKHISTFPRGLLSIPAVYRKDVMSGKINPGILTQAIFEPEFMTYVLDPNRFSYALNVIESRFKRMKIRCTKDIPHVILFIPSQELVSPTYTDQKQKLGYKTDPDLVTFPIDSSLEPILKKIGYIYISPLAEFRKDGCRFCYYPLDLHLSPEGHKKFADVVTPLVQEKIEKIVSGEFTTKIRTGFQ